MRRQSDKSLARLVGDSAAARINVQRAGVGQEARGDKTFDSQSS
jgi:hypothetical protein